MDTKHPHRKLLSPSEKKKSAEIESLRKKLNAELDASASSIEDPASPEYANQLQEIWNLDALGQ